MRIILLTILLFISVSAFAQTAQTPPEFVSREGRCSILFPVTPAQSQSSFNNAAVSGESQSFQARDGDLVYGLVYSDYKQIDSHAIRNDRAFVYNTALGYTNSLGAEQLAAINADYNDYPGRSLSLMKDNTCIYSRLYFVHRRLYQSYVIVDKQNAQARAPQILQFLNSFRLLDSDGKPIENQQTELQKDFDPSSPLNALPVPDKESLVEGGDQHVKAPRITGKDKPDYSESARKRHLEGVVTLSAIFRKDGKIDDLKVLHSLGYGLDEAALRSAGRIKFHPGEKSGQKVSVRARLEFTFNVLP